MKTFLVEFRLNGQVTHRNMEAKSKDELIVKLRAIAENGKKNSKFLKFEILK
jgi:uncharacterized protein YggU (UPF0235/DUF167 family)